jgi:hypothetical protein
MLISATKGSKIVLNEKEVLVDFKGDMKKRGTSILRDREIRVIEETPL